MFCRHASTSQKPLSLALVVAVMLLLSSRLRGAGDVNVQRIVDNIIQNQSLYANIDVRVRTTYSVAGPAKPTVTKSSAKRDSVQLYQNLNENLWHVTQGGKFRVEISGKANTDSAADVQYSSKRCLRRLHDPLPGRGGRVCEHHNRPFSGCESDSPPHDDAQGISSPDRLGRSHGRQTERRNRRSRGDAKQLQWRGGISRSKVPQGQYRGRS